uniref:Probable glucan 1,3-alpha-glucosidase n=1 Tax=Phallusia mammillata TaxID=59560 RepID=A0A6F9DDK9_9ASCI|nr:probable glucan 1,3-alpha-glucosidase [Phallusia mammillata]
MQIISVSLAIFAITWNVETTCGLFTFKKNIHSLEIFLDNRLILKHTSAQPAVHLGVGTASYKNNHGNFDISSTLSDRVSLNSFTVLENEINSTEVVSASNESFIVNFFHDLGTPSIYLKFSNEGLISTISVNKITGGKYNRLWLKFWADPKETIYGGGEQFNYFSLRGRSYPMWAREQGVGRNKSTIVTYFADLIAGAGGDYHTTYWPQPTFVSDRMYFMHLDFSFFSLVNLTNENCHELELWEDIAQAKFHFNTAVTWKQLLERLTDFLGRQPTPPEWLYNGAVIGVQGGTDEVLQKVEELQSGGVKVSGIWIQDWSGKFVTSFGKRVYWNWQWDPTMYPRLDVEIKRMRKLGIRFLSYINPHVIKDSPMYQDADAQGFFIKSKETGKTQLVDFGEFDCGTVDLTNPDAYKWYKNVLKGMLEFGFSGWMADFGGEYIPAEDAVYFNGRSPKGMHNSYSELWAKLNKEAVTEAEKINDTFIFMRSGFGRSPGYTLVNWAGDQNVDFSYADGLASVIPAALSMGMSGMGFTHSDVGGYFSDLCVVRTEELVLRWGEMNVFTPILRTHEGNRPNRNWQVYTTEKTIRSFARLTQLYTLLTPYHKFVAKEVANHGYPAQRPLFFHYPDDPSVYDIKFQYLYGSDLLVAPVFLEAQRTWQIYLPPDRWVYLWNGTEINVVPDEEGRGITVAVNAEIGNPPVFYRKSSDFSQLFQRFAPYVVYRPDDSSNLTWHLLLNNPTIFIFLIFRKVFWYVFLSV